MKSLNVDCSSKECGNTGWGREVRLQLQGDGKPGEVLSFICGNLEHIYLIIMKGRLKIYQ